MRCPTAVFLTVAGLVAFGGPYPLKAQVPDLTDADRRFAADAISAMKTSQKGPYIRIRWFCADGTVQPPQPYACSERGGGSQHGEYSEETRKLHRLGLHVGTILAAESVDSLFGSGTDNWWLKELVLDRYLEEVDDGWVLRRARYYRGARQIEDEEARGQELLERAVGDSAWTARHYLLASLAVASVPHPQAGAERRTERIRALAIELADLNPGFLDLRVKIHTAPTAADLGTLEAGLARLPQGDPARPVGQELAALLAEQYDPGQRVQRLAAFQPRVTGGVSDGLSRVLTDLQAGRRPEAWRGLADLSASIRRAVVASADGRKNVTLLDLNQLVQETAYVLSQELIPDRAATRAERLQTLHAHVALAYGAGFLSWRERTATLERVSRMRRDSDLTALEYRTDIAYLARSLEWAYSSTRAAFGPLVQRYSLVEPASTGFQDALVRASNLLALGRDLDGLALDADENLGASHLLFGQSVGYGVRGMNPGVSLRPFELASRGFHPEDLDPGRIYLLPETVAELRPVAGVLTLDEGNLLSHVQLLARNLGIPNAMISSEHLALLRPAAGQEVFYAVSPMGRVVLARPDELPPEYRALAGDGSAGAQSRYRLDTSRLDLGAVEPIALDELRATDSGIRVGPKAANLGQLGHYFPGRVSAGVALPFGMFRDHVDRPFDTDRTVLAELQAAYARADSMRESGTGEDEVDRMMFAQLELTRQAIMDLEWRPETLASIRAAITRTFGTDLSGGVFIRSDTNVEDLPQFSGAGLNLTVPHRTSMDDILLAIRRVWTSPFSERAYLWRKQILETQGDIYPSVLLLASVHSDKSGVLITSGLHAGSPDDLTIATAEGVGGAVDGEDAETVVVSPAGRVTLLSQAKAPLRRTLLAQGGAAMVPSRRPDTLLQPDEVRQLMDVVAEWRERFAPGDPTTVWDMEFGFVDGRLWLFQVRPFVRFRSAGMMERLAVLDAESMANAGKIVDLQEIP